MGDEDTTQELTLKEKATDAAKRAASRVGGFIQGNPKTSAAIGAAAVGLALLANLGGPPDYTDVPRVAISEKQRQVLIHTEQVGREQLGDFTEWGMALLFNSNEVPGDALCNLTFEAVVVEQDGRPWPDVKGIRPLLNAGAWPVLVRETEDKVAMWNVLARGADCPALADLVEYAGSDLPQVLKHPKKKFLVQVKAKANKKDKDGHEKDWVEVDDPDADPEGDAIFTHEWAGLGQVNYAKRRAGKLTREKE
jgi:hypothetical protein